MMKTKSFRRVCVVIMWCLFLQSTLLAQVFNSPPTINCLKDIKIDCDPGETFARVVYTRPKAFKNGQPLPVTLLSGYESGSIFPLGITAMLFEARDELDNKVECRFTVTVGCPNSEFTMHCPQSVTKNTDAGKCGTAISYNAPYSVGNSIQVVITQPEGLRSGSFFPAGTTKNTFTGTLNGIAKSCSFYVTVNDIEKPEITCPPDISITIPDNEKGAAIKYIEPVAKDNCGIANMKLLSGLKSGSIFPSGITTQTFQATDYAGNTATCSLKIEVKSNKTVPVVPVTIDEKLNVGNDSVVAGQKIVSLKTCNVTLCIYDDAQQDGDSVSIIFNNKVLVDKQLIKVLKKNSLKNAFIIPIELQPDGTNFIISKAWNMGTIPPNTLKIDIYEGNTTDEKKLRELKPIISRKISSRPGLAGAILLKCSE